MAFCGSRPRCLSAWVLGCGLWAVGLLLLGSFSLSTKYSRQSTEGGARGGRLSVDSACNQEPDGDTRRRDSDLDRFGLSGRRNTLRPVSLVYCIEMYTG